MLEVYYVNDLPQENGDHEVHKKGCHYLSIAKNVTYLGLFSNCNDAVNTAKKKYKTANGCYYCANACHTS